MLLRLMWFRNPRSSRARQSAYKPAIERLEDRALLTASWNSFGGNAQHTEISQVAAQPVNQLMWSTSLDLAPWGAVHYGDPIFTPGNTVIVPVKVTYSGQVQGGNNFFVEGLNDVTGAVEWTSAVTGSITGATNASPIVFTSPNNGLANGATVSIGGVVGNTAANGTFTITKIDANTFSLNGTTGNGAYTSGGLWAYNPTSTSYIDPKYSWTPPYQPVYDPVTDRVYFPGPGGTLDYIAHPDSPGSSTPTVVQEAFYGTSNYTANTAAYNSSIYINTGLTVDSAGNVYFGFTETGSNPSGINDGGIAKITPSGVGSYVLAATAVGQTNDGNWTPALGSSPALSKDGSTLYLGINDAGYNLTSAAQYNAYLVGVNTATMTAQYSVHLIDPSSGSGAGMVSVSTASPVVAPDNTVFQGVFGNPYNGSRGYLLHFSANLSTEYTPGAFGWDDSPSIIPASMVPSYTGSSPYLIISKYNNYANTEVGQPYGGNGVDKIAILDPYASQLDPNYDSNPNLQVMQEVMTFASPSPDLDNQAAGDPNAVREWCTNGSVVDPATDSVFVNNEDGYTYQWNLGTGLITNAVEITSGIGVPYTPTAIGPNGEVFSDNGGTLFALGGYTNYSINTVSSANPAVVGNSITLTTTLASTNSGPTPTGTVTFSYYEGANNLYNGNTTPITIGTDNVVNGVATITIPAGLAADHYHVTASYSGDGNYSAGKSTIVLPVLETATTTITSSSVNPENAGGSVTFTVTVAPNGTGFVPIGTVTFIDGSTVLGTVSLNSLNNSLNPPSTNTATFTTTFLGGTHSITAVYNGDNNFASGTSAVFNEYVPTVTNPGPQTNQLGDSVSLQIQAANLFPGDSWTYSVAPNSLPVGLSIDASTGLISGTVALTDTIGNYATTVIATEGTNASASQQFLWSIDEAATTTTLVASPVNPTYGQTETLTATVSSRPGIPNDGTVSFYEGTTPLGDAPVVNGIAQWTPATLTAGLHAFNASYNGDGRTYDLSWTGLASIIQTVAGTGTPGYNSQGLAATATQLNQPVSVAYDAAGDLFIADAVNNTVYKVDATTHAISAIAGNGVAGRGADGLPGYLTPLDDPTGIAVDAHGNVFIADSVSNRIREVNASTGVISTVAGTGGLGGYNGDGIAATSAKLNDPTAVAVDAAGNIFFVDAGNERVREVTFATGLISTIAGTGTAGYNGDGIAATAAQLNNPSGIAVDTSDNVYVSDTGNERIRKVTFATGLISTIAGTGTSGYNGDGIAATAAQLSSPSGISLDASGDLFIADSGNSRIREVKAATGLISTTAGTGIAGYNGDGSSGTSTEVNGALGVVVNAAGNIFIADSGNARIREVNASTGLTSTVAGTGVAGHNGDNVAATSGEISNQPDIAVDAAGDLFIADVNNNVIREVNAQTGIITTVAGNGTAGFSGDGGLATSAELNEPTSVAVDAEGDIFIADFQNNRIREVNAQTGLISTIANISQPDRLAIDGGNVLVSTPELIQEVNVTTLQVTTIAGNGFAGYNGDGIPATSASLDDPMGMAVDAAGNIFFADYGNIRVREINASTGLISTVAGNGVSGYNGDGIAATSAELTQPRSVAVDAAGNLFIADYFPNDRVREVIASTGTIFTVAGNGVGGYNGDGILATSAELLDPTDVVVDSSGNLLIADRERIREVANDGAVVAVTPVVVNPGTENNAVGDAVSLQVQANGLPAGDAWTYSATGLPSGLSINGSNGTITGTITGSANTYSVSIAAFDEENVGASQTFTWNVSTLSETNPGTQNNGVGDVVSLQIHDSGLPSGDSWSYSATGLPNGLSISTSTGLITGTIAGSANTYSSSVTASDGHGGSVTQAFSWKVFFRPAITGPSSATVTENNPFTFSAANGNEINVSDQSAGSNSDSLTLSVSEGTLVLGTTSGLTFTAGANGSASFTVTGTIGNLEAALNGLTYTPFTSYTGPDTLSVSLADPTDTLNTSSSVAITVNPFTAPAITAPSTVTVSENGSLVFSSGNGNLISFTDNGSGFNSDSMTLSVNHGTLTLGTTNGLIFSSGSNGSAGFTVKASVANLNAALAGMTYQPTSGYAGSDTLAISVNDPTDNKSASTSVAINVSPLAPSITAPVSASLTENGSLAFSTGNGNAISLTDANPGSDSLTLSVSHGTLTLSTTSGLSFTAGSNGSASFTVSGTISNLNAALNGLTYQPTASYSGSDTLAISLVDPGDTLSASKNVSLSVNALPAPSITSPATATVLENNSLTFSSNSISVADSAAGGTSDSLSLAVSHGTLTLSTTSGLTFTAGSNGSASFTVTGTVTNLNAALNNLKYTPTLNYTGSDSLSISITDPGDNESASKSVAITVNAFSPPSVGGPASASVPANGTLVFSSANSNPITVADSGPGSGSDSLQLTVTHGTVTLVNDVRADDHGRS